MKPFEGKKLLILGGNAETIHLVKKANELGAETVVASSNPESMAKQCASKKYDTDATDVAAMVSLAKQENISGVLPGTDDVFVPAYCKVCDVLGLPCYASSEIIEVFGYKDCFKATCERYGIHGVPEYYLDLSFNPRDLARIKYPVMVKPVDCFSGIGMTECSCEEELRPAVEKAVSASKTGRFIVEKLMTSADVGLYYTFKDGECSLSCIFDRYTTSEQTGSGRVALGNIYPSRYIGRYYERLHENAKRLFKAMDIKNGVLLIQAFYENEDFYVYDTGFRLQSEASNLLIEHVCGYDQRELLINFALTGSEGELDLLGIDDPGLSGKYAASVWFLLREGTIGKISGLESISSDSRVIASVQRLFEGDEVLPSWPGTEQQVMLRLFLICGSKPELAAAVKEYQEKIRVSDINGGSMLLQGFDVMSALEV